MHVPVGDIILFLRLDFELTKCQAFLKSTFNAMCRDSAHSGDAHAKMTQCLEQDSPLNTPANTGSMLSRMTNVSRIFVWILECLRSPSGVSVVPVEMTILPQIIPDKNTSNRHHGHA